MLTNLHNNFHAGYYYLIKELAKHEKVACYGNFDTRRKLFPLDINNSFFARANLKFGKGWHKLSKKLSRKKRVGDIKRLSEDFDVAIVLLNSFFAQVGYSQNVDFIKCRKVNIIADIHLGYGDYLRCIQKVKFDLILFVYKWWMNKLRGKVQSEVGLLPHSVNTEIFKDYGLPRKYDVVSAGTRFSEAYPLREKIYNAFSTDSSVKFSMPIHPQLTMKRPRFASDFNSHMIRENYARFLSQSKIFAFGSSIHNYALAKYVEGMASGTLVLAPKPKDFEHLGFKPYRHFVPITSGDFNSLAHHYLKFPYARRTITEKARKLVEDYHSTKIRCQQLREFLHGL